MTKLVLLDIEKRLRMVSPELLARAAEIVSRQHRLTDAEILAGGLAFVMGPCGDEGTRAKDK